MLSNRGGNKHKSANVCNPKMPLSVTLPPPGKNPGPGPFPGGSTYNGPHGEAPPENGEPFQALGSISKGRDFTNKGV